MKRIETRGFTLIEILITLTIVGILAAIAIPSYNDSIRKNRRAQAKADMVETIQSLERCFTNRSTYLNCFPGDVLPAALARSPRGGAAIHYNLDLPVLTDTDYTIRAVPTGDQAADVCGSLAIRQNGVRTTSSGRTDCW
jgi:type IV pilus assembly protein PilE